MLTCQQILETDRGSTGVQLAPLDGNVATGDKRQIKTREKCIGQIGAHPEHSFASIPFQPCPPKKRPLRVFTRVSQGRDGVKFQTAKSVSALHPQFLHARKSALEYSRRRAVGTMHGK